MASCLVVLPLTSWVLQLFFWSRSYFLTPPFLSLRTTTPSLEGLPWGLDPTLSTFPQLPLFLPHCSHETLKSAKWPVSLLALLFWFLSHFFPFPFNRCYMSPIPPPWKLIWETAALIIALLWRIWVQCLDLWYWEGVYFIRAVFITNSIPILTLERWNSFRSVLQ